MAKLSKKRVERSSQLAEAKKVLGELGAELKAAEKRAKSCSDLSDHLTGFYAEIDKLAKGKTLVEATPLVVEQANDIIQDAKRIVENDVYLDRIKIFVPAGNNPVYPDVLLVARAVRQSLQRATAEFKRQKQTIKDTTARADTVIGALECFLSGEENGEFGLKDDVERYVDGQVDSSCFSENENVDGEECFDFDSLDSESVEQFIRGSEVGESGAENDEDDLQIDVEDLDLELDEEK